MSVSSEDIPPNQVTEKEKKRREKRRKEKRRKEKKLSSWVNMSQNHGSGTTVSFKRNRIRSKGAGQSLALSESLRT